MTPRPRPRGRCSSGAVRMVRPGASYRLEPWPGRSPGSGRRGNWTPGVSSGRLVAPARDRAAVSRPQFPQRRAKRLGVAFPRWSAAPATRRAAAAWRPLAQPTSGSTQWNAVADTIRSKGPLSVKSSKADTWNRAIGSGTVRLAASTIAGASELAGAAADLVTRRGRAGRGCAGPWSCPCSRRWWSRPGSPRGSSRAGGS